MGKVLVKKNNWEYYDSLERYDDLHFEEQKKKIEQTLKICSKLGLKFENRGLDIGSGTSSFFRILNGKVINLEPSMLIFRGEGMRVQGKGEKMPFKDSFFDYCVSFSSLHHCNLEDVLGEVKRVLKKDGFWVFSFFKRGKEIEEFRRRFSGKEFDIGLDILRIGKRKDLY